jgi:hypothetical protein
MWAHPNPLNLNLKLWGLGIRVWDQGTDTRQQYRNSRERGREHGLGFRTEGLVYGLAKVFRVSGSEFFPY